MTKTRDLPMFPLGSVLFPGMPLPLHVFEPRYRALTGWCLEHDRRFGVVLIERGWEVGGGDARFRVGTVARILDAKALPDGRWLLMAVGERRITVDDWVAEEPFPRARVSFPSDRGTIPDDARAGIVRRFDRVVDLLRDLGEWAGMGDEAPALPEDPRMLAWQLAASGLFGPADAQRVLEVDDVGERLALVTSLLDEEIEVLALRAGGR